ncbi:MAG: FHA domain-containing protein [Chloroflexota bacterium]
MSARLIVQQGPNANDEYPLTLSITRLGRGTNNELIFKDPELSRQHAQIAQRDGIYYVDDLGSTNGTFLNNQRVVNSMALQDGDEIRLGETIILQFVDLFIAQDPFDVEHDTMPDERPLTEQDTPPRGLSPISPPPESTTSSPYIEDPTYPEPPPYEETIEPETSANPRRRWLYGCGCLLLALFLCTATLFFLDTYQQGRLLYCGPIRPLFELVLGPFGFSPLCG